MTYTVFFNAQREPTMKTYTVFFKAEVNGVEFLSSTSIHAASKDDAAARVLSGYSYARHVTSVMVGR